MKKIIIRIKEFFLNTFTLDRYFLVCYSCNTPSGSLIGQCSFSTNGRFLNNKLCLDYITEVNHSFNATNPIITNIIEIKKSDNLDWIQQPEINN